MKQTVLCALSCVIVPVQPLTSLLFRTAKLPPLSAHMLEAPLVHNTGCRVLCCAVL
jgi:hypothetical protein